MPCDTLISKEALELQMQEDEYQEKIKTDLETLLASGQIRIVNNNGTIEIEGWYDRPGNMLDICALSLIATSNKWEIQQMIHDAGTSADQLIQNHSHSH